MLAMAIVAWSGTQGGEVEPGGEDLKSAPIYTQAARCRRHRKRNGSV